MDIKAIARWLIRKLERRYRFMSQDPTYRLHIVGRYTYGRPLVMSEGSARLTIGSFCSIGDEVRILLGGNHRLDWVTTYPFSDMESEFGDFSHYRGHPATKGDVVIGNDVWIGHNALILSGVTIGDGAVIGARSVVTKSVSPYAVAVGNPARVVRARFSEDDVRALLTIQWWDWPLDRIKENMPLLLDGDIKRFISAAQGKERLGSEATPSRKPVRADQGGEANGAR